MNDRQDADLSSLPHLNFARDPFGASVILSVGRAIGYTAFWCKAKKQLDLILSIAPGLYETSKNRAFIFLDRLKMYANFFNSLIRADCEYAYAIN